MDSRKGSDNLGQPQGRQRLVYLSDDTRRTLHSSSGPEANQVCEAHNQADVCLYQSPRPELKQVQESIKVDIRS